MRIDPYIINKERDINGDVVKDGIDNKDILSFLKDQGFKKKPLKENEQVTWMFSLNLEGKTEEDILKEMKQNTRNIIKKTEKIGIKVKELSYEELPIFNNILKETGIRRNFTTREKEYYEDMYNIFHDKNEVKYFITELNLKEYVENLTNEINEKEKKLKSNNIKQTRKEDLLKEIKNLENQISELEALNEKYSNLQSEFGNRQQQRKNKLSFFLGSSLQNQILEKYYNGMNGLLNGFDFNNAYDGLSEAKSRIIQKINQLNNQLDNCKDMLAYRKTRRNYWKSQLANAMAEGK